MGWRIEPTRTKITPGFVPYLVLLRVGFAMPRTLLPGRCALTAPFHPYRRLAAQAVFFLWHFPSTGLDASLPDVIRHTALRSSDFPPAALARCQRPSGPAVNLSIIGGFRVWALGFSKVEREMKLIS